MATRGEARAQNAAQTMANGTAKGAPSAKQIKPAPRNNSTTSNACTPAAPTRLSFIASKALGPAPRPSAVSMAPSRWRPPVSTTAKTNTRATWAARGNQPAVRPQTTACSPPSTRPTRGAKRAMRSKRGAMNGQAGSTE